MKYPATYPTKPHASASEPLQGFKLTEPLTKQAQPHELVSTAISRYAHRPSQDFEHKLARSRRQLETLQAHPGFAQNAIVQASSLGAEDMVITDLLHRAGLLNSHNERNSHIAVFVLDTGLLHSETLNLLRRAQMHYGFTYLVYQPDAQNVRAFEKREGVEAMYKSLALRKACCAMRKLEPLQRALQGKAAWLTGMRSEQSDTRAGVGAVGHDGEGREKINLLHDWTWGDVWHYIARFHVPYNPLHDAFMPSIGCAPCTRAISDGESFRAGRWWWEGDGAKECGLHPASSSSLAPTSVSTHKL